MVVSIGAAALLAVGAGSYALHVGGPERDAMPRRVELDGQEPSPRLDQAPPAGPGCQLSFATSCATWIRGDRNHYGNTIALSGDTFAVDAGHGKAHVYARTGSTWAEEAIHGRDGIQGYGAVSTIALSGDTLAVASPDADGRVASDAPTRAGAVFVYVRDGGWIEQARLVGARENARLGTEIALDGDTIAAVEEELVAPNRAQTSIAVFVRDGHTWTRTESGLEGFGKYLHLALDGDTLVVCDPTGLPRATHVFLREGERWTLQISHAHAPFERRVALDEDTLAIGDLDGIHVFTRTGSAWTEQAVLRDPVPTTPSAGRQFGSALALHGDLLAAIGYTTNYNVNDFDENPEVFLFARSGRGEAVSWRPHGRIDVAVKREGGSLALALDRDTLAVGTPGLHAEDLGWHGAVFLLRP